MAGAKMDDDEKREDWFEVMGLSWDATADDVKDAYRKLALKYHPDKNQGDPKAADRFMLVNKAKIYLADDDKRSKLSMKKKREAAREKRHTQRFAEMDAQRKRFKSDLEAREAGEREKARMQRTSGGGAGGGGGGGGKGVGINAHVLDELRKVGLAQREAEARRIEELMHKSNEAAAAAVFRRAKEEEEKGGNGGATTQREGKEMHDGPEEEPEQVEEGKAGDAAVAASAAAAAAAALGIGTSTEVKAKWKRSTLAESHSDESLYQLLVRFGPIKRVEMTGIKGNTATIIFDERSAAERAVAAYEFDANMRLSIPADRKYKLFLPQVLKPPAAAGAGVAGAGGVARAGAGTRTGAAAAGKPSSLFMGVWGAGSGGAGNGGKGAGGAAATTAAGSATKVKEGDVLARMRAAASERKRRLEEQAAAAAAVTVAVKGASVTAGTTTTESSNVAEASEAEGMKVMAAVGNEQEKEAEREEERQVA